MGKQNEITAESVEISVKDGVAFIEQASPLTRLHYFDGKFLRADAFAREQDYHRSQTRLANLAGGWGAVHGLGISLSGNQLSVGAGLAITAAGNFVLASGELQADLASLLKVAAPAPVGGNPEFADCLVKTKAGVKESAGLAIYEITVGPVEGLCGNEAVYGKLCESACVSDSQHPYWREGVVLRLRPIGLKLPASSAVTLSVTHLRNRVASAYFAAEPWLTPRALSAAGLASDLWCKPASLYGRDEVVIGLLAREAGVNRVIDAWSGRRERMDTQARGYWQGRMAMRPWNVFVAQVLQFQCQLAGLFDGTGGVIKPASDCEALRQLLDKTRQELEALHKKYSDGAQHILRKFGERPTRKEALSLADEMKMSYAELYDISGKLSAAELGKGALPSQRMLLNAGFVELPPAGYLPVAAGKQPLEIQLARMFGAGVRLHFHAVRDDEIAHLVEEAQHMERISLTRGLDDPKLIEAVEIFVPDGIALDAKALASGTWWQVDMHSAALSVFQSALKPAGTPVAAETPLAQADAAPQDALNLLKGKQTKSKIEGADAAVANAMTGKVDAMKLNTHSANNLSNYASVNTMPLQGLARTEGREDGSYGLALIVAPDSLALNTGAKAEANYTLMEKAQLQTLRMALYFSGDISADPFELAVGGEAVVKAEMRMVTSRNAVSASLNGRLTVLNLKTAANGFAECLVQLDMSTSSTVIGLGVAPQTSTDQESVRFSLLRKGDSGAGTCIIDDPRHDPQSPPVYVEWDPSPRRAAMYVMAETAQAALGQLVMKVMARKMTLSTNLSGLENATNQAIDATRLDLANLAAMAAMPAITSIEGVNAMNAIVTLADVSDDPAFLVRARQRLFPNLDALKLQEVRGVHDWVMFRRARTHLSGPVSTQQLIPSIEAFQVWHLKVDGVEQLRLLAQALIKKDVAALAKFKFQRVGILRYRDESAYAEESADRVLAMWQAAQPASQVMFGRIWESAPTTGQGWQNHFRLRNMLEQIAPLTKSPENNSGAVAVVPAPPAPLADGALDGGMLVVTMDVAVVKAKPHRVVALYGNIVFGQVLEMLKKDPAQGMELLNKAVADKSNMALNISLQFSGDQLDENSTKTLADANTEMLKLMGMHETITFSTLLIKAAQIESGVNPEDRHKEIVSKLGEANMHAIDSGMLTVTATDLGAGAQLLTLVSYSPDPT